MYVRVPAINGIPDIGETPLIQAIGISDKEAVAHVIGELQEGWIEITKEEFEQFIPPIEPEPVPETTEEKLARLEEQNLILMDALATTFEEILALRAIVEGGSS